MGIVFGKVTVAEPAFEILLERTSYARNVKTSYEIRKYGERFAAEVAYDDSDDTDGNDGNRAKGLKSSE